MKSERQLSELIRMDKRRELYHPPQMEIFEIKVEKGFAASTAGTGSTPEGWSDGGAWN